MEADEWLVFLRKAGKAVEKAVKPLAGTAEGKKKTGTTGAGGDETLEMDKKAEDVFLAMLEKLGEDCTLISEELGEKQIGNGGLPFVVVDPIDGSFNMKHGLPNYGFSAAVAFEKRLGDVEVAYVRDLSNGDEYHALRGKGAFKNGQKLATGDSDRLEQANFTFGPIEDALPLKLLEATRYVRSLGSIALDTCKVAEGLFDFSGIIRHRCRVLDIAAAKLIVEEAGGVCFDKAGGSLGGVLLGINSRTKFFAARNSKVKEKIVRLLEG